MKETKQVYCPNGHAISFWGSPFKAVPGQPINLWGNPLKCGECGATVGSA